MCAASIPCSPLSNTCSPRCITTGRSPYRVHHKFAHSDVALSAGIQHMVRSDIGASGVAFTLDTESGFRDVVLITAAYGLGETVVQGAVNPDEFYVTKATLTAGRPAILRRNLGTKAIKMIYSDDRAHGRATRTVDVAEAERLRFCLTDTQVQDLARQAVIIEKHYGRPMDIEWACDGEDGKLYILQARPETVKSRANGRCWNAICSRSVVRCWPPAGRSASVSAVVACASSRMSARWPGSRRVMCW